MLNFILTIAKKIKPIESRPPLGLLIMSSRVLKVTSLVDGGNTTDKSSISVSCNPVIGM